MAPSFAPIGNRRKSGLMTEPAAAKMTLIEMGGIRGLSQTGWNEMVTSAIIGGMILTILRLRQSGSSVH